VPQKRVDHHVAHQVDPLLRDTFAPEVLHAALLRAEQQVADGVGEDAVDLLGHRPIEAAQARLDVDERDPELRSHQTARDRAVHVANDHHGAGIAVACHGLERLHDLGGLHGGAAAHAQVQIRLGNAQLPEEQVAHVVVVVLAGVHEDRLDPRDVGVGLHQGSDLHQVGPGPDDVEDPHATAPWPAPARE
jgi:hypothetical protein